MFVFHFPNIVSARNPLVELYTGVGGSSTSKQHDLIYEEGIIGKIGDEYTNCRLVFARECVCVCVCECMCVGPTLGSRANLFFGEKNYDTYDSILLTVTWTLCDRTYCCKYYCLILGRFHCI